MSLVSIRRRVAFIPAAFAPGYLLLSGREAVAHADHYQTEQHEQPPADSTQSERSSEPAGTSDPAEQGITPIQQGNSEANGLPGSIENESETATEQESATPISVSASESSSIAFNGFAGTGIGESLLTLIIAAPFVLRVLKRRLKS